MIYWLIHSAKKTCEITSTAQPAEVSTPELSLASILTLSALIAQSTVVSVPESIYGLFESVITARSASYSFFQNVVTKKPDPEIAESNNRHKAFIDTLVEAFNILGGETWTKHARDSAVVEGEDDDDAAFMNKYAALEIKSTTAGDADEPHEHDEGDEDGAELKENTAPTQTHKKGKKGKKGKGKKKAGRSVHKTPPRPEPTFQDIPLESYKIVDEKSTMTDYLLAVYSLVRELGDLRL